MLGAITLFAALPGIRYPLKMLPLLRGRRVAITIGADLPWERADGTSAAAARQACASETMPIVVRSAADTALRRMDLLEQSCVTV